VDIATGNPPGTESVKTCVMCINKTSLKPLLLFKKNTHIIQLTTIQTDDARNLWMYSLVMLCNNVCLKLILHVYRIHYFNIFV